MKLIKAILDCPLRFFDVTPTGRIINRACKDQNVIDGELSLMLDIFFKIAVMCGGALITIGIICYYFFPILAVLVLIYFWVFRHSIQCARDTKRIESIARSPMISQYTETLDGIASIRIGQYGHLLWKTMREHIVKVTNPYFMNKQVAKWMNSRAELVGAFTMG